MKYLKKVILENFQSHKYTELEFDEGLNIIVGQSDSGKSAILRGIKWVLFNEPSGDFFIKEGETDCTVTLIFNDNTKVERFRSRSKNIYTLYYNTGEEIVFQGFGTGVPKEISEVIGIDKIDLDGDEANSINIGEQLDGPFLLSEKTSTRASAIGRLIGVDVIDDALRETLRDVRGVTNDRNNLEKSIESLSSELKEYEYLEELKVNIDKLNNLSLSISNKQKLLSRLEYLNIQNLKINKENEELKKLLDQLSNLEKIGNKINEIEGLITRFKYYDSKNIQYKNTVIGIDKDKKVIDALKSIDTLEKSIANIENKIKVFVNLNLSNQNFKTNIKNQESINIFLNKLNIESLDEKIKYLNNNINTLNSIIDINNKYKSNLQNLTVGNKYISRFMGINEVEDKYNHLLDLIKRNNQLLRLNQEHKDYLIKYKSTVNNIKKIEADHRLLIDNYEQILSKMDRCPLCFSEINEDKREHIIKHYN